ncbi:N-acetyltransferase [Pradoshia eiseniae]|uniref:N-acetyltransferase n=1 Tax=Pradoshia eiseniae TaxID=2064768 RepID=A0A2S7MYF6_9BACI|nr:GNAT family N-acetyltransferase [Pradoshia eiseniae]PQD94785.1 N-acetyltransferase [Pradoshia eiseniae]
MEILKWDSESNLHSVVSLYQTVWNDWGESHLDRIKRHTGYKGFRGYIAMDEGDIIGYAYGYSSLSGQYYHELLNDHLSSDGSDDWLNNCFEFVELAVHPKYRKRGIGALLHDQLLNDLPFERAILTTQTDNWPAISLYRSKGWVIISDSFLPLDDPEQPFIIFGKTLSAAPPVHSKAGTFKERN